MTFTTTAYNKEDNDMAITEMRDPKDGTEDYKGLSTDTKPNNAPVNSMFLELDTGDLYYYDGDTWSKVGG